MPSHTLPGEPPITLDLRRSDRARRIILRVGRQDGAVTLTLPRGVRESEGLAFAAQKRAWLEAQLADRVLPTRVSPGSVIPVLGTPREIVPGLRTELGAASLYIAGPADRVGLRTRAFLKTLARDRLASASGHYAEKLGRPFARITLRDTRSRWGSCSSAGNLMYSWRLVMAPEEILDYVAAHEVAHLKHMDHSRAFWRTVHHLYGDPAPARAWLRREGASLQAFHFGD
ncbi:hypothetical protein SAMN05421688_2781 [Poseidonocella pacifica]|uniref:YgjP-like metallopeptidase domain-containing protein n=1 Tax=Poseidonocella pacifica TaxID=871651 RepID=A0A1I0Y4W3_9RHOB|nr:SprT family zinc-dependent metalloprotease [Poseidonocella pacifica]SFB07786.1 hypothetical protein SAMN05421688_2781 [Poseidonocella pacifica]